MRLALLLPFALLLLFACKKDEAAFAPVQVGNYVDSTTNPAAVDTLAAFAKLDLSFLPVIGTQSLTPITKFYKNSSNESFTVTKFNYYVTNVRLKKEDGTYYEEPQSYHLIKHIDAVNGFSINDVPAGKYVGYEFLLGVDSLHNVSGAQSGALDPANQMFWDWNTGYIYLKLEGRYASAAVGDGEFAIHVGGFQAPFSCLQKVSLSFPTTLIAKKGVTHQISTKVDVLELFKNPATIGFDYYYEEVVKGPKIFQDISLNYRDMFTVDKAQ
jgi:hypothetical protein